MTTYAVRDLEAVALGCDYDSPPFRWNEERRFQIRCELEAAYFHLDLGPESEWCIDNATLVEMFPRPRDALSYIMDTFPIVRRKDEAKYVEYRTKRVIIEIYDQMAEIIEANEANEAIRQANPGQIRTRTPPASLQLPITPQPPLGPPTVADGNFIPYADWTDEIHRQYAGLIHPPRAKTGGNSD